MQVTKQQAADETYQYILQYQREYRQPPSQRHLAEAFGVSQYQIKLRVARLQGQGRLTDGRAEPTIIEGG